jgi:predicted nucleic acid-binding protein
VGEKAEVAHSRSVVLDTKVAVSALVTGDKNLLAVTGKSRMPIPTPDALKTEMQM